jgi:hypothetical protein
MSSLFLPELLFDIFSNLETDSDSLFSCCLVSREWSISAVYWLWKRPFHICPVQNGKLLIRTCLKFSSYKPTRFYLFYYDDIEQPPLFNYTSFLQHLNFHEIYEAAWHFYNFGDDEDDEHYSDEEKKLFTKHYIPISDEEKKLFMEQDLSDDEEEDEGEDEEEDEEKDEENYFWEIEHLKEEIISLTSELCQTFLLHSNKIVSLNLCTSELEGGDVIDEYYINIFKLKNAASALANIKKFVCGGLYDLQSIINIMINICHNIEILEIIFEDDIKFEYSFLDLTKSQKNLKELKVIGMSKHNFNEMIDSLSYQSHSLRILHFESSKFKNGIPFEELSLLQNLESLILIDCDIESKRFDYYLPSLKKLHLETKSSSAEEIEILISSSLNLEEIFLIGFEIRMSNIFDIIANNCFNIKILDISIGEYYIKSIIQIFIQCQQLELISLQSKIPYVQDLNEETIGILAKNIPKNLNNLNLMISMEIGDFKAFFSQLDGLLKVFGFKLQNVPDNDEYLSLFYDDLIAEIDKYAERKCVNYHIVSGQMCDQYYIEFNV